MSTNRNYNGPVSNESIETIDDFKKAMKWLVKEEALPGARLGNSPSNVGETIEAALGQPPSTTRLDFALKDGNVEI